MSLSFKFAVVDGGCVESSTDSPVTYADAVGRRNDTRRVSSGRVTTLLAASAGNVSIKMHCRRVGCVRRGVIGMGVQFYGWFWVGVGDLQGLGGGNAGSGFIVEACSSTSGVVLFNELGDGSPWWWFEYNASGGVENFYADGPRLEGEPGYDWVRELGVQP